MDPKHLLETFGTIGLFAIIFAETGLLIGFFLPGDSLLLTAGAFCAAGPEAAVRLHLGIVLPGVFLCAVAGAQTGWYIGHRAGPTLLRRPDSRFFKQRYVDEAADFFERGGVRSVVLARFVPVVRTFLNPMAGIARMPARTFLIANLIGGLLWSVGVTMAGYVLGKTIDIDRYLLPVVAVVVVLSLIPVYLEFRRRRRVA